MDGDNRTIVSTKSGRLEGTYEDGLFTFRGVPYAEPPVGDLRWMPPRPVKPWDAVRPAKESGTVAPQSPPEGGIIPRAIETHDESCLFLNIWTPGLDDKRRPVLVWIHGGAFSIGSGSSPVYDGRLLS